MSRGGHNKIEFNERDIEQIETMSGLRMPMRHIAAVIGVSQDTIERRMKTDEAIAAAVERGRASAANAVYRTAFDMAVSGKVPAFTMFWLKCQEGWKEGQGDEELRKAVAATTENVAKLYEIARMGSKSVA